MESTSQTMTFTNYNNVGCAKLWQIEKTRFSHLEFKRKKMDARIFHAT